MLHRPSFLSMGDTPHTKKKVSKALESLVQKRHQQIAYLRRVHLPDLDSKTNLPQPRSYWLNTIQLSIEDINSMVTSHKRIRGYFCLMTSLGKLIDQDGSPSLVNALIQLVEEYIYEFGGKIAGGFAYLKAKNIENQKEVDKNNIKPIKPVIWKQNNKIVFQFLDTPKLPEGINYCLVTYSLLSVFYIIYGKFLDPSCSHEKWRHAIEVLDERISQIILKPITDILTKLTFQCVNNEIKLLLPQNIQSLSSDFYKPNDMNKNNGKVKNSKTSDDLFDFPMVSGGDIDGDDMSMLSSPVSRSVNNSYFSPSKSDNKNNNKTKYQV